MEQITYLLFRRGTPIAKPIFPKGNDPKGRPHADLRWSNFREFEPRDMFNVVADHVFPFLRTLGADGSCSSSRRANTCARTTARC